MKHSHLYIKKHILATVKDLFSLTTRFPAFPRPSQCSLPCTLYFKISK